jgi:hypothetical protein
VSLEFARVMNLGDALSAIAMTLLPSKVGVPADGAASNLLGAAHRSGRSARCTSSVYACRLQLRRRRCRDKSVLAVPAGT